MSRNVDEIVEQARPDLIEAVQLDQAGNKNDALQKYMQGISTLMGALKYVSQTCKKTTNCSAVGVSLSIFVI